MELLTFPLAEEGISHGTSTTSECRAGYKWPVSRVCLSPQLGSVSARDRPCWSVSKGTNAAALAQSRHQLRHRAGIWVLWPLVGRDVDAVGDAELSFLQSKSRWQKIGR